MKLQTTLLLLLSLNANALEKITTKILGLENLKAGNAPIVVSTAHSAEKLEVDPANKELVGKLKTAQKYGFAADLKTEGSRLLGADLYYQFHNTDDVNNSAYLTPTTGYRPNNIPSYDFAKAVFDGLYNKHRWFDQCFNRAHIWSKQMFDNNRIHSMKILIYYTKKYRKEVSKKWWFHIAPMVSINGELYVMDREFTRKPITADEWESIFTAQIGDKAYRCKKIDNISEYYDEENMKNEYCNIQFTSMYYWEPNDMSKLDKTGEQKTQYVNWELRAAAKEAFSSWRTIYKRHQVRE